MSLAILRATLLVATAALSFNVTAAQRTFVSTSGSDANTASNCSNTLPCRGFTAALTVTDSGGEIIVLSSGGYGPVTINKSVSIIAPEGIYTGISVFSGDGITIATPGVDVVLRGLTINSLGGNNGIVMSAGNSLVVQNCVISNFSAESGLDVSNAARVRVLDSLVRASTVIFRDGATVLVSGSRFLDTVGSALIVSATGAGVVTKVEVNRSEASGNTGTGFYATGYDSGRAELNIKDSVASRNNKGVLSFASAGTTFVSVSSSLISGNITAGLQASNSGAKLVASGNKVSHNGTGLSQGSPAVLQSTGDNTVSDNTTATSGTITALAKM